jgi:single-stranded DNA-specific DHH superfamily exonuclease
MIALNNERKDRKRDALASDEYKAVLENDAPIKVYVNDELPLGLNGLIASSLSDLSGCPAIVFCKNPDGIYVGSGRNADGYPSALDEVKASGIETLKLGGHADAFGLSVAPDKMQDVIAKLEKHYTKVKHEKKEKMHLEYEPKKGASCPLTCDDLMRLEPYGPDFAKVRVEVEGKLSDLDVTIQNIKRQDNPDEYKKFSLGGITFTTFQAGAVLTDMAVNNIPVRLGGDLNVNTYGDRKSLQVVFDTCEASREKNKEVNEQESPDFP